MDKVLLVDFANQLWRANMSWGKPQDDEISKYLMIYNFFRNFKATVEHFSPNKIFLVLEGHPKHRYEIYSEYKANRIVKTASKQETHDKFYLDQQEIIRLVKYLPVTLCKASNYECDDVIATLAENMSQEEVIIISNDSDYIQLLQRGYKDIKIYNPIKKSYMQAPEYPYVAWKSLRGDTSDNIIGLMSDAKAEKLLLNPELFAKWIKLEENRAKFSINKQLIEFADVPVEEIEIEEGQKYFDLLKSEFIKMKFNSIINDKYWNKFYQTFNNINI